VVLTGIFLIAVGAILILARTGFIPGFLSDVLISWPMLLIAIGVYSLLKHSGSTTGVVLILIGGFFIMPKLDIIPNFSFHVYWPVILIVIGIYLIYNFMFNSKKTIDETFNHTEVSNDDFFEDSNIFGGGHRIITSQNLRGGKVSCIFGGTKIELAEGKNIINTNVAFGGIEIIVPAAWHVSSELQPIFGGVSDKRMVNHEYQSSTKELVLRGGVIFGGVEIKNYQ
jgi:predicted membrane protein